VAEKDYYLILGVARTETPGGIQKAFRELAKRYHPDHAGPHSTEAFREILEAYRILSDTESRRAYTDRLVRAEREEKVTARKFAAASECFVDDADGPGVPPRPEPLSPLAAFAFRRPLWEALWSHLFGGVPGRRTPRGGAPQNLSAEIYLSAAEAARGVDVRLEVPMAAVCAWCGGRGHRMTFLCAACGGRGMVEGGRPVTVHIPAGVPPGAVLEVPLHHAGLPDISLRLHIRLASRL
jgi:DnaJ-class molecular chaperone